MPRYTSSRLAEHVVTCATAVVILAPPDAPTDILTDRSLSTRMVGVMEERGRFPG